MLNVRLRECPVGVEGEICIGEMGLTQGYLNDTEKTVASFVWREASSGRIHHTRDRGCYLADEQVTFLGCNDIQMKVNGYRIKLGEVKDHLEQLDSIGSTVVMCHQGQLYALITAAEGLHPGDINTLLARVRTRLIVQLPYYLLSQHSFLLRMLPAAGSDKAGQAAMVQEVIQRMS